MSSRTVRLSGPSPSGSCAATVIGSPPASGVKNNFLSVIVSSSFSHVEHLDFFFKLFISIIELFFYL